MPRKSVVESHEQIDEINRLLIERRLSQEDIAKKYGLTRAAIRWHFENKIEPKLREMKKDMENKVETEAMSTVDALNQIIAQMPKTIDNISLNHIIRALELRSKVLGEEIAPPRIEIVWGRGLSGAPSLAEAYGDGDNDTDKSIVTSDEDSS